MRTLVLDPCVAVRCLSQSPVRESGELIGTGTPPGVGGGHEPPAWVQPGDVSGLGIPGLGGHRQTVVPLR